jgi:hypothetical protein
MSQNHNRLNHATWECKTMSCSIFGGGGDRVSERKSSIWIARNVERKLRNFLGHQFWTRLRFDRGAG